MGLATHFKAIVAVPTGRLLGRLTAGTGMAEALTAGVALIVCAAAFASVQSHKVRS